MKPGPATLLRPPLPPPHGWRWRDAPAVAADEKVGGEQEAAGDLDDCSVGNADLHESWVTHGELSMHLNTFLAATRHGAQPTFITKQEPGNCLWEKKAWHQWQQHAVLEGMRMRAPGGSEAPA